MKVKATLVKYSSAIPRKLLLPWEKEWQIGKHSETKGYWCHLKFSTPSCCDIIVFNSVHSGPVNFLPIMIYNIVLYEHGKVWECTVALQPQYGIILHLRPWHCTLHYIPIQIKKAAEPPPQMTDVRPPLSSATEQIVPLMSRSGESPTVWLGSIRRSTLRAHRCRFIFNRLWGVNIAAF